MIEQEKEALLDKIEVWHANNEHQKIVEAIESLEANDWTPELTGILARAYNNLGDDDHLEHYGRAIHLLETLRQTHSDDHYWNFRMGYALFYIYRPGEARHYFERALELMPGDETTLEMLEMCHTLLSFPRFPFTFQALVNDSWANFVEHEEKLRQLLDSGANQETVLQFAEQALEPVMADAYFQVGKVGERYRLVFTADSRKETIFDYLYFKKQAPMSLAEHWDIVCGVPPTDNGDTVAVVLNGLEIKIADLEYHLVQSDDKKTVLQVYSEKFGDFTKMPISTQIATILTKQLIGEARFMRFVPYIEVIDTPSKEGLGPEEFIHFFRLSVGESLWDETNDFSYVMADNFQFTREGNADDLIDWYPRKDITAMHTCFPELLDAYQVYDERIMDYFHSHGVVPGFLIILCPDESLGIFKERFQRMMKKLDSNVCTILGFGVGNYYYVDFLSWDLIETLKVFDEAFRQEKDITMAAFSTFRRGSTCVVIKKDDEILAEGAKKEN